MGWSRALTKDFILFCKMVQPLPSSLQSPSLCHCHCSCRPCHRPHPRPPPSSPSPLPSLSLLPLLARQPCHHLHCLAALTLLVAFPPHHRHSRCRCHRPRCCSPCTLVAVAIALATVAIAIIIARHPHRRHNRPLNCLCLHLPATLVAVAPHQMGEGRTIPIWCTILLWPPPSVSPSSSPPQPPAQPAGRGRSNDAQDSNARQTACADVGGSCRHSCSRRHSPHQPTAVAAVAAAAVCRRRRRRRCWQRGNKVNEDNNNNMTTTQQPTQQPTRQPTKRGDN
jgi:hypothetical protein